MSGNPYERVRGGRLTFKGGDLASRSKTIDKRKKKKNKIKNQQEDILDKHNGTDVLPNDDDPIPSTVDASGEVIYTIDAAKKMKYEDLFPVEAKKFGYDPNVKSKSIEEALDDRIKKKADRYCK
ncbi:Protein translocase subunit SecA [Bienertia sinuspersici]